MKHHPSKSNLVKYLSSFKGMLSIIVVATLLVIGAVYVFRETDSGDTVSLEQVTRYVNDYFDETDGSDRITDKGFAYSINPDSRACLDDPDSSACDIVGAGPLIILKSTGEVYKFGGGQVDIFGADTQAEFDTALKRANAEGQHVKPVATIH